jgi:hypothetical protein
MGSAGLEQAVSETADIAAKVGARHAHRIDAESLESMSEFQPAAADVGAGF